MFCLTCIQPCFQSPALLPVSRAEVFIQRPPGTLVDHANLALLTFKAEYNLFKVSAMSQRGKSGMIGGIS